MLIDQPVVNYKTNTKADKKSKDGWKTRKASKKKVTDANERWEQKKAEIDAKPKTFSLAQFSGNSETN